MKPHVIVTGHGRQEHLFAAKRLRIQIAQLQTASNHDQLQDKIARLAASARFHEMQAVR